MNQGYYFTIEQPAVAEFKDRGSRFIGYAFPADAVGTFKEVLADVKKQHPRATHHCFAYRIGVDGAAFRVSDDGEPSGSAGRPILGQIDSRKATNVVVVVVRYFGGTLLGVPGLINAYKTTAALVLQVTPLVQKPVLISYQLQFDYTQMNEVMMACRQVDCKILKQEMNLFCTIQVGIPQNRLNDILNKLRELRGIEIEKM
jgi:uncharacterized YigZ family protein